MLEDNNPGDNTEDVMGFSEVIDPGEDGDNGEEGVNPVNPDGIVNPCVICG